MKILKILELLLFSVLWKRAVSVALIVPQELPSVLSLIYSNIPPIRKGTDSRVGFGFRLGEHADFQVIYEIGPQINTRKIGDSSSSDRKRYTQPEKKDPPPKGTAWLQRWAAEELQRQNPTKKKVKKSKPAPPKMSMGVVNHLQQLYGLQKPNNDVGTIPAENQPEYVVESTSKKTTAEVEKITADLANVEFDDF